MESKLTQSQQSQELYPVVGLEMQALLQLDESPYPWSATDPASAAYFDAMEQDFGWDDWSSDEVAARSEAFFSHVDALWPAATVASTTEAPADSIVAALSQRFAMSIPQTLLSAIAQQARRVVDANVSLADQLVACAQEALPAWSVEDLQVMARPLAYAMRGTTKEEAIDQALASVQADDWQSLSEIEQARLSLVVARYAIAQVEQSDV